MNLEVQTCLGHILKADLKVSGSNSYALQSFVLAFRKLGLAI